MSDNTGQPEPKYFRLWQTIQDAILPAERSRGKPKPEAVYREAQDALNTLASQWAERFKYIEQASDEKDKTPPVMIIVCDNIKIAEYFFQRISGETVVENVEENGNRRQRTRTVLWTRVSVS